MSHLVCRARGKNELAVGVKWQTVDLRCVGVDCMAGFGGVVRSSVPADEQNDIPLTLHRKKFSDEPFCPCVVFLVIIKGIYIMSFWSSATDPKRDSWSKCQETSSTTAVWPVKIVFASTTLPSFGTALMSHRQTVFISKDHIKYINRYGFAGYAV